MMSAAKLLSSNNEYWRTQWNELDSLWLLMNMRHSCSHQSSHKENILTSLMLVELLRLSL